MSSLSNFDIGEFRALWLKETGQSISTEQAQKYAENLLGIVQLLAESHVSQKEEPP